MEKDKFFIEEVQDGFCLNGLVQDDERYVVVFPDPAGQVISARLLFSCFGALYDHKDSAGYRGVVGRARDVFAGLLSKDWLVTSTFSRPAGKERYSGIDKSVAFELFGAWDAGRVESVLEWISGAKSLCWYGDKSDKVAFGRDGELYVSIGGLEKHVGTPYLASARRV